MFISFVGSLHILCSFYADSLHVCSLACYMTFFVNFCSLFYLCAFVTL